MTWDQPTDNGGRSITGYKIYRDDNLLASTNLLEFTDNPVTNGVSYSYYVVAINMAGDSPSSDVINALAGLVPSAPLNLRAVSGDGQLDLTWDTPVNNGGIQITAYNLYVDGVLTHTTGISNSYVLTGLTNGNNYQLYVTAINSIGISPESNIISAAPVSPITTSSAPENLQASAGISQVSLTWDAPLVNGGAPVTGYIIFVGEHTHLCLG